MYLIIAERQCNSVLHLVTSMYVRPGSICGISPSGNVSESDEESCEVLEETELKTPSHDWKASYRLNRLNRRFSYSTKAGYSDFFLVNA